MPLKGPLTLGSDSARSTLTTYFSAASNTSASPARVDGWRQVCPAFALRRAPPGPWQGGCECLAT